MLRAIQKFLNEQTGNLDKSEQDTEQMLQIAASVLLIEISRSDATVSEEEEKTILQLLQETFSLDKQASENLVELANEKTDYSTSFHEFTQTINTSFSHEEKINLVKLLWHVALADGHIDKYEDFYIRKIASLLYVSHSEFMHMKHQAKEERTP